VSERIGQKPTNDYLAGYLDADGCVRFSSGTPRVEISSVFPWILEEYILRWGGSIRKMASKHSRPVWRWIVSGDKAERCLLALLPYLYVKKAQSQLVLQARRIKPGPYREAVIAQLKALKHQEYHG
jgi:hypothetical protein